jgi:hypothetical protein
MSHQERRRTLYDKIAEAMNTEYSPGDSFEASDIEDYLRNGTSAYVNSKDAEAIEMFLERYL